MKHKADVPAIWQLGLFLRCRLDPRRVTCIHCSMQLSVDELHTHITTTAGHERHARRLTQIEATRRNTIVQQRPDIVVTGMGKKRRGPPRTHPIWSLNLFQVVRHRFGVGDADHVLCRHCGEKVARPKSSVVHLVRHVMTADGHEAYRDMYVKLRPTPIRSSAKVDNGGRSVVWTRSVWQRLTDGSVRCLICDVVAREAGTASTWTLWSHVNTVGHRRGTLNATQTAMYLCGLFDRPQTANSTHCQCRECSRFVPADTTAMREHMMKRHSNTHLAKFNEARVKIEEVKVG